MVIVQTSMSGPRAIGRLFSARSFRTRLAMIELAICLVLSPGLAAASTLSSACGRGWLIVPSPTPPGGSAIVADVASFPQGTAWAVGFTHPVFRPRTMALHEDGSGWTVVPTPNPDPVSNRLDAVDGVSDNDVWAVGTRQGGDDGTLVEHWNGVAWSARPSPSPPHAFSSLDGVSAVSASDVWAVGSAQDFSSGLVTTLIEHWNGRRWIIVPSPNPEDYNYLQEVSARSATDAWAVGSSSGQAEEVHNLILHWDGTSWTVVDAPSPGVRDNTLFSAASLGSDDAWAVGYAADGTQESDKMPVTLHWDGTTWNLVPNPTLSAQFNSVAAAPNGELWAAGYVEVPPTTLIERWDGSAWRRIRSQNQQGAENYLNGIALGPSADSAWAVGSALSTQGHWHTLIEHPCGAF
jgi:hypothetical protein